MQESLKKDETDFGQFLLDIQNHLKDEEKFEYDLTILEKYFIAIQNSIERIRKISYYISRGVSLLLEGLLVHPKHFRQNFHVLLRRQRGLL